MLDASPALSTHFAIGSLELVRADLLSVLPTRTAEDTIAALAASGAAHAFHLRRELVNFKKACLLLLQDAERLERAMARQASFFAREVTRCEHQGHDCPACASWRASRRVDLQFCVRACQSANTTMPPGGDEPSGYEATPDFAGLGISREDRLRQNRYLHLLEGLNRLRGVRVALLDMRLLLKAICLLPRHPDDAHRMPKALVDMPAASYASAAVARAEAEAVSATATVTESIGMDALELEGTHDAAAFPAARATPLGLHADTMHSGISQLLSVLPTDMPEHVSHYVRQSLVARGAAKALAQAEGARVLASAVERLQQRTSRALEALRCANKAVSGRVDAEKLLSTDPAGTHNLLEHDTSLCAALSHAMKVGNHLRVLSGLHMANEPMLRSLQLIMSSSGEAQKPRRLFDASDASSRGHSAMRFPPTFAPLVQLLRESQEAAARNEDDLRDSMSSEGWPPSWWSPRQAAVLADGPMCRVCETRCPRLWQDRNVCWRCDEDERKAGRCPYDVRSAKGRARAHPFCPHQSRCAVCDAGFISCVVCRLAHGDGEAVLAACEAWKPSVIFVDFDRTLCTTKSGANPLHGEHSVDAELHETAARFPVHVLTRNRHTEQIRAFLAARGVPIVDIHSTPTGESKAQYMQQVLAHEEAAVFVDDDANEMHDPRVAGDARLFRVLFERA